MKNVVIVVDKKKWKEIEKFYSIYAKENKNEYGALAPLERADI